MSVELVRLLSRDHDNLFAFKSCSKIFRGTGQTLSFMVYENVFLKLSLNQDLPVNSFVFKALVNWYAFKIKIFKNSLCYEQNVCYYEGNFKLFCENECCEESLLETILFESFLYLKRGGDSIHDLENRNHKDWSTICSLCKCGHCMASTQRCTRLKQLGYYNQANCFSCEDGTSTWLTAARSKNRRRAQNSSILEVFHELGINIPCNYTIPMILKKVNCFQNQEEAHNLLNCFIKYGNFNFLMHGFHIPRFEHYEMVEYDKVNIFHALCSTPLDISCMTDIIKTIQIMDPEPFEWVIWDKDSKEKKDQYGSTDYCKKLKILREIESSESFYLIARKILVYHTDTKVNEKTKLSCVFFPVCALTELKCELKVDPSIKNIWKEAGTVIGHNKNETEHKIIENIRILIEKNVHKKSFMLPTIDASLFKPLKKLKKYKKDMMIQK